MDEETGTGAPSKGSPPSGPAPGLPPVEDMPLATSKAKAEAAAGEAAPEAVPGSPAGGRRKRLRKARPHPYASEASPPEELRLAPRTAFLLWAGAAIILIGGGYLMASQYSPLVPGAPQPLEYWQVLLDVPLFLGIGLLGFGFSRKPWARKLTMLGWLVGAFYGGLWAQDLFYGANSDYVNYAFSILFGLLFVYLAYHEWLSVLRGVQNAPVRFLSVSFFVGAGAYFLIDKIQAVRLWLIYAVSDQTKWMLDLFGQGDKAGLRFIVDKADNKSPTTFFYPDQVCEPPANNYGSAISDPVEQACNDLGMHRVANDAIVPDTWWGDLLHFAPDGDNLILPVSIILACTALQSIMVFVGLFAGTTASLRRKVYASLIVGAVVYVLNLIRNTGIIWFYGQGHASFWVMHDAIGKGGSLLAMVAIAFGVFRYFPEFLQALFGVLDLIHRDGPIERFLKIGRRRPPTVPAISTI